MGDALMDSFEDLYRASCADMVRLAYLITGSIHVAEEVTHDSYIAMHKRWESIGKPNAYLRKAVVNGSRSHLRRLQTQRNAPVEPLRASFPDEIDETWQLIQQLPSRRRTALVLLYYLDLPVAWSPILPTVSRKRCCTSSMRPCLTSPGLMDERWLSPPTPREHT
jgi:DNA-directed RNA polymerase specialized sigma24 family protein